ncbi:MAG: redoxin domain-containing protein [Acidobacteriota bacterium]
MKQLGKLLDLLGEKEKEKVKILAVSPDSKADSLKLIHHLEEKYGARPDFPLLGDEGHKVIDRYGLLNTKSPGWPHPAVFVLDRTGTVTWRFVETNYRVRAPNEEILKALEQLR